MTEIMSSQLIISIRTKGRVLTKTVAESLQKNSYLLCHWYSIIDLSQNFCFSGKEFYLFIYLFLLKYSRLIVLCQFLVYSKVIQLYVCMYMCVCVCVYIYSFPLLFIKGYWIQFSVVYSRSLLFIYFVYTGLYLLIPNS